MEHTMEPPTHVTYKQMAASDVGRLVISINNSIATNTDQNTVDLQGSRRGTKGVLVDEDTTRVVEDDMGLPLSFITSAGIITAMAVFNTESTTELYEKIGAEMFYALLDIATNVGVVTALAKEMRVFVKKPSQS